VENVKWTDEHIDRVFEQFDRRFDRLEDEMRDMRRELTADMRALRSDFNQLRLWLLGVMLTMALAIAGAYLH
jgi:hypothetical protein